jgi:hypothetical protein
MSPAEDALLLLRLAERHLGSLRGTLDPGSFAEEDWGFLAQQTLEKLLKALLVLHCQGHPAAIRCNVCCRSSPAAAKPWATLQNDWSSMTSRCWPAMTPSPLRCRLNAGCCWSSVGFPRGGAAASELKPVWI